MSDLSRWKRTSIALGLTNKPVEEVRATPELPILVGPNQPTNAVNLTGTSAAVSEERALGLAGVFRAVSIISTAVSQLELGVWRNGQEVPQTSNSLVVRPDYDVPLHAFLEQTVTSLAVNGNAYWKLTKSNPTAEVKDIEVLDPTKVTIEWDNGHKYYREGDTRYPAWRITHLMHARLPGFAYGVGPIQVCQNELRGALNLRNYADNWFTDAGIPNGILKTDQVLPPDMADATRDRWESNLTTNRMQVLGSGLTYTPVYLSPADAQFLESQAFTQTQIARMFGVPAVYLMTDPGNSMTYANMQDVDAAFLRYTLSKYLKEIEAAFTDLIPRGQDARFKTDGLLRANTKERFDTYSVAINAGFMTVDEARSKEGLPPLDAPVADNPNPQEGTGN